MAHHRLTHAQRPRYSIHIDIHVYTDTDTYRYRYTDTYMFVYTHTHTDVCYFQSTGKYKLTKLVTLNMKFEESVI